jgi:hypothetical protein
VATHPTGVIKIVESWAAQIGLQGQWIGVCASTGAWQAAVDRDRVAVESVVATRGDVPETISSIGDGSTPGSCWRPSSIAGFRRVV